MANNQELTEKINYVLRAARDAVDSINCTKRRSLSRKAALSDLLQAIADIRALSSHLLPVLAGHVENVAVSADVLASVCGAASRSVILGRDVAEASDAVRRQCVVLLNALPLPPPSTAAEALEKLAKDCEIAIFWFRAVRERHKAARWNSQYHDEHEVERYWYEDAADNLHRRAGKIADALIGDGLSPPDVPLPNHPTPLRALQNWIRAVRRELATRGGMSGQTGKAPSAGKRAGEPSTDPELVKRSEPLRSRPKNPRGRRPLSPCEASKREALVEQWRQAKIGGIHQKEFCQDEDVSLKYLTRCINWLTQRRCRKSGP